MAGPGVFSGYVTGAPDAPFVEPGWVNSGDLGRIDAHGYLWITGRAKDLVIRGGHNIDPLGIEEVLYEHAAVAVAALVGEPDAYAGELPVAYVELKPGMDAQPSELLGAALAPPNARGSDAALPHRHHSAHGGREGAKPALRATRPTRRSPPSPSCAMNAPRRSAKPRTKLST
jgi:acyl-CoA synthetase (AMP-forming)/AMP-acid ligase II